MKKFDEIHKEVLKRDMRKTSKNKIFFYLYFGIITIILGLILNGNMGYGFILVMGGILVGANIEKLVTYSFRKEISKVD